MESFSSTHYLFIYLVTIYIKIDSYYQFTLSVTNPILPYFVAEIDPALPLNSVIFKSHIYMFTIDV